MKKWFQKMSDKAAEFMQGRYGTDELNRMLSGLGLVLMILSMFPKMRFFYVAAILVLIYSVFRSFSKNVDKRRAERARYLKIRNTWGQTIQRSKNRWRDRKTHRYYMCPTCKTYIRIRKPERGKTISIRCPQCGSSFVKKT